METKMFTRIFPFLFLGAWGEVHTRPRTKGGILASSGKTPQFLLKVHIDGLIRLRSLNKRERIGSGNTRKEAKKSRDRETKIFDRRQ
jgi:hypothetical protein